MNHLKIAVRRFPVLRTLYGLCYNKYTINPKRRQSHVEVCGMWENM